MNSHFGWLVSGPTKSLSVNYTVSILIIDESDNVSNKTYSDHQLVQDLNKFWNTEAIDIIDHKQQSLDWFPPEIVFNWEGR